MENILSENLVRVIPDQAAEKESAREAAREIVVRNLTYTITEGVKKRNVLDGIDFEIPSGRMTTISGPSGSGKTTFLNAIAGLLPGVKGTVRYGNTSIYSLSERKRDDFRLNEIGFIFQDKNLFSFLNVEDNIRLYAILRNQKTSPEFERRLDNYLARMNMKGFRKKEVRTLSGGEKQRVAILRAFLSGAKYIFADEPTGSLDSENSRIFMDSLKEIMEETGITTVLVTHDPKVFAYGDCQAILEDGKIA